MKLLSSTRLLLSASAAAQSSLRPSPLAVESPAADIPVYLKHSSNPRRKPSFYVPRMREESHSISLTEANALGTAHPLFTISSSSCEYYALRLPLLKGGFKRVVAPATSASCNLIWGRSMPFRNGVEVQDDGSVLPILTFPEPATQERAAQLKALSMSCDPQRFNHFPLSHRNIGCKRGLSKNIQHLKEYHSSANLDEMFSFVPRTWCYPEEKEALFDHFRRSSPSSQFIWKPARGSCGRGILFSEGGIQHSSSWKRVLMEIEKRAEGEGGQVYKQYVVQEYINDPLLLEGRKMDLRLYVAVTSYDPLIVYLHEDGLVRLAAETYGSEGNSSSISSQQDYAANLFRHLTNYSVGRRHSRYAKGQDDKEASPQSTSAASPTSSSGEVELKWSLQRLWKYIDANHHTAHCPLPSAGVKEQIAFSILRTLMGVRSSLCTALHRVRTPGNYFEVYGFDVMLRSDLSPVLLEVNTLPSLESSSPFDYATKSNVVADLLNLSMMEPFERDGSLMETISSNTKLLKPPDSNLIPFVHTLREQSQPSLRRSQAEEKSDLHYRLQDEFAFSRGFHRIFPPVRSADDTGCVHVLRSDNVDVQKDLQLFEKLNLLTRRDRWALHDTA